MGALFDSEDNPLVILAVKGSEDTPVASLVVKGTPLWATAGCCLAAEELFRRSCSRTLLLSGEDTDLVRGVGASIGLVGGVERGAERGLEGTDAVGPTTKVAYLGRLEGVVGARGAWTESRIEERTEPATVLGVEGRPEPGAAEVPGEEGREAVIVMGEIEGSATAGELETLLWSTSSAGTRAVVAWSESPEAPTMPRLPSEGRELADWEAGVRPWEEGGGGLAEMELGWGLAERGSWLGEEGSARRIDEQRLARRSSSPSAELRQFRY